MEALGQYAVSVVSAAMICGIVTGLLQDGAIKLTIKLLCGIFMTVTVLDPMLRLDISGWKELALSNQSLAQASVDAGTALAQEELAAIIKEQTQAYILDKATSLGLDITAQVVLSDEPLPVPKAVYLCGAASPYTKQVLSDYLCQDLGITKENQIWTG